MNTGYDMVLRSRRRIMPGQTLVHPAAMGPVGMVDGAHDGQFLAVLGEQREVFAESDAGSGGRNVAELALVFGEGVGLRVKGLLLGESAPQEKDDAGFRFRGRLPEVGALLKQRGLDEAA